MIIQFIKNRRVFYTLSLSLIIASTAAIVLFGLNLGIDFTGGSVLELEYKESAPGLEQGREALAGLALGDFILQKSGERSLVLKTNVVDEAILQQAVSQLEAVGEVEKGGVNIKSIGPVIGQELKKKSAIVLVIALLAILIYIALSFRKVSRPVKSWVYGFSGIIALFHDVLVTLGVLVVLGRLSGVEISIPIVTAFLTIFGYSINDSVVVFDRLRENLVKSRGGVFEEAVNSGLNQSLKRSINTSFTTIIALLAIFFLGGATLKYFALSLILGIGLGTYSSLFISTPLLVSYLRFKERKYRA